MSKHYDDIWQVIESIDGISGRLTDILDDERDRRAKPHLCEAMKRLEEAVSELENINPDDSDDGTPPSGSIVIGKFI